jgi:hypothetical protein
LQPLPEIQDKENHFADIKINYWATSGLSFILRQKHRLHQLLKKALFSNHSQPLPGKQNKENHYVELIMDYVLTQITLNHIQ